MIKDVINLFLKQKDFFINLLIEHLRISIVSVLLAIFIGLIIGILISEVRIISKPIITIINFVYTIPSISLLGFLIPFSGIGNLTAIIALTVYALLPMVRNTYTGITNIDKNILEAAKGMGSTRKQILFKIKIPLALPIIISGIRSLVTMTIALAGIASFIGAGGLGVAIYRGITTNNAAMTMTGSLLIAFLAIVMDFIIGIIEKRINAKYTSTNNKKNKIIYIVLGIMVGMILLFGLSNKINPKKIINIATKPMTEQYIIGEMLKLLIEQDTNLSVKLTHGVGGGTSNIQPAMEKGEFDIYPEYTGTGWNMVLKKEGFYDESVNNILREEYKNKFNMTWAGMYGFKNTYGLAVRKEIADKHNLKTYSDLAKVSEQLIFGAEYDFYEREDGFDELSKEYNFKFNKTIDLDIGLKYQAINQKKTDVMNIFTTDGQLSVSDIIVLIDDRNFYPSYMCGNIIRNEIIDIYPELLDVFKKLENSISDEDMANMNYQVEAKGKEPKEVAATFLRNANLLK